MKHLLYCILYLLPGASITYGQNFSAIKNPPTHADTLRGSITPERTWWDVKHYNLYVYPDYDKQLLEGRNTITYSVVPPENNAAMQIDLQPLLHIDSAVLDGNLQVSFTHSGNVWLLDMPKQQKGELHDIAIYYSGRPTVAASPPGDGGITWEQHSLGRPWIVTSCQGIGASIWYPCKDHQSDEPDNGATVTIRVPDTLVAVSNGRLKSTLQHQDNTASYKWEVKNTINNYGICFYVGKYVNIKQEFEGLKGDLDMDFWVLDYNTDRARQHLIPNAKKTVACFEKWMGPYPFYKDGFKMVDVPFIGMEHQSAVAYGNRYKYGFRGKDISQTGWGMKYDVLIVHEVAHEWFGNSITTADLADKWIHEGFAGYAEMLYLDDEVGTIAANEYSIAKRKYIANETPVTPRYGINEMNGQDDYSKGRAIVHMIRQIINDDKKFRKLLLDMNEQFYHSVTTSAEIEAYISKATGIDFSGFFDQYLRRANLPVFEYTLQDKTLRYRYTNCAPHFAMPLKIQLQEALWLHPTTEWKTMAVNNLSGNDSLSVDPNFYLTINKFTEQ